MASQVTIDYAAELRTKLNTNADRIALLSSQPSTDASLSEIRQLKNSNSAIQHEFASNKDLSNYALSKTKPSERLGLLGLAIGAPALLR